MKNRNVIQEIRELAGNRKPNDYFEVRDKVKKAFENREKVLTSLDNFFDFYVVEEKLAKTDPIIINDFYAEDNELLLLKPKKDELKPINLWYNCVFCKNPRCGCGERRDRLYFRLHDSKKDEISQIVKLFSKEPKRKKQHNYLIGNEIPWQYLEKDDESRIEFQERIDEKRGLFISESNYVATNHLININCTYPATCCNFYFNLTLSLEDTTEKIIHSFDKQIIRKAGSKKWEAPPSEFLRVYDFVNKIRAST